MGIGPRNPASFTSFVYETVSHWEVCVCHPGDKEINTRCGGIHTDVDSLFSAAFAQETSSNSTQ